MDESFWQASFALFLITLPASVIHAIVALGYARNEGKKLPAWLGWLRGAVNVALVLGAAALTAHIAARWADAGYPPFSNLPESLAWMAWGFCATYLVARLFWKFAGMETAACVGVLIIMAVSSLFKGGPAPLMPALQSNWLIFHVFTCMLSYGALFAAFCMAILWLAAWRNRESGSRVDALSYHLMAFGFLLLTVGIASGAVWAKQAWGRYWGWDPKETWSLITWLVYGIYLHFRRNLGSFGLTKERIPWVNALFALIGFLFVVFTYFGVSYLLPSLHSYASG